MKTQLVNESLDSFLNEESNKIEQINFSPADVSKYKKLNAEWKVINRKLDSFYKKPTTDTYKNKEKRDLERRLRRLELDQAIIEKKYKLNLKVNFEDAKRFKKLVGASDLCTVHFD